MKIRGDLKPNPLMPTTIDLTKQAPRSPRVRHRSYSILPRMLDTCRATLANASGEYHYTGRLDVWFTEFTGIDAEALKQELATC
jgi:hypothetical protein